VSVQPPFFVPRSHAPAWVYNLSRFHPQPTPFGKKTPRFHHFFLDIAEHLWIYVVESGRLWSRMFRGSYPHTLDDKGRIIVPTRFRDFIRVGGSDTIMITGMDRCLFAYTLDDWGKIEARILAQAESSDHMRRFRRSFVGNAHECQLDRQGRVLIPPQLRGYAALDRDIVLVGVLNHFEIWSKENWDRENEAMELDLQKVEVRNEIAKLGL
jgi:MraZ protein